jgi:hypothetical protein
MPRAPYPCCGAERLADERRRVWLRLVQRERRGGEGEADETDQKHARHGVLPRSSRGGRGFARAILARFDFGAGDCSCGELSGAARRDGGGFGAAAPLADFR